MIKSGLQHLENLRDGRVVYIGDEKVEDVTTHPAFARAAKTVAQLYDIKHDPVYQDMLTFEEGGNCYSAWFLQARSREDLRKRMKAHKIIADQTCGMMGRSMGQRWRKIEMVKLARLTVLMVKILSRLMFQKVLIIILLPFHFGIRLLTIWDTWKIIG